MTEEQIREFWKTQQIIHPSDITVVNGVPLIVATKMSEIINKYHFTGYSMGQAYPLYEVGMKVMEVEYNLSKQQRRNSDVAPVNIVYRYFNEKVSKLEGPKKSNPVFLAWEIDKFFHNAKQSVILDGLIQAQQEGIIEDYHLIENAYRECQEIKSKVNLKTIPEDRYLDTLWKLYQTGTSFPQLVQLVYHSGLSRDVANKLRMNLWEWECREEYAKLRPELKELADNSTLQGMDFVRELQKRYRDYDMRRIVSVLKSVADKRRIREISTYYDKLCPEDAYRHIEKILIEAKQNKSDASEIVAKLLGLGYHPTFIWKTIKTIKNNGLNLNYDEIDQAFVKCYRESKWFVPDARMLERQYKSGNPVRLIIERNRANGYSDDILLEIVNYMKSNGMEFSYEDFYNIIAKKDVPKQVEQEEQATEAQMQVPTAVATQEMDSIPGGLSETSAENSEVQPTPSLENPNPEPEANLENSNEPVQRYQSRRIVQVRRAKSALERRAIVSLAVATAGAVSSAVLINLFGVNPLVAARNCYASITAGNATLAQLLPAGKELISIFASVGTTIAGTIMYLRNDAKLHRLERREEMRR